MSFAIFLKRVTTWTPVVIFSLFSLAWLAMVALTYAPGSTVLWMANMAALRLFRESIYLVHDMAGVNVLVAAAASAGLAVAIALGRRRGGPTLRFLGSHLALGAVALPVIHSAVAAGTPEAAFNLGTSMSFDLLNIDAARLGLVGAALFACVFAHVEVMRRATREKAVRDRARRLLSLG